MNKNTSFYSVCLPLFLVLAAPKSLYALLPLNFIIDVLVVRMALGSIGRRELFAPMWKKEIWLCALASLLGTCAGGAALYGVSRIPFGSEAWRLAVQGVRQNPFISTNALIIVFACIIVAAAFTYLLTLWLALRKTDLSLKEKRTFCLAFALFTAPYAFILPTAWFIH
ncbi:MAG: hypothetical protein PHC80_05850 [Eubacteriales bacterium]|nr:hypothetical protein [Eubacteriales bacterium]